MLLRHVSIHIVNVSNQNSGFLMRALHRHFQLIFIPPIKQCFYKDSKCRIGLLVGATLCKTICFSALIEVLYSLLDCCSLCNSPLMYILNHICLSLFSRQLI